MFFFQTFTGHFNLFFCSPSAKKKTTLGVWLFVHQFFYLKKRESKTCTFLLVAEITCKRNEIQNEFLNHIFCQHFYFTMTIDKTNNDAFKKLFACAPAILNVDYVAIKVRPLPSSMSNWTLQFFFCFVVLCVHLMCLFWSFVWPRCVCHRNRWHLKKNICFKKKICFVFNVDGRENKRNSDREWFLVFANSQPG